MIIHWKIALGNELSEAKNAKCPHCNNQGEMRTFELITSFHSIPLPKSKMYRCNHCSGFSRCENRASRIINILFIIPLMLIAAIGMAVGLFGIPYSIANNTTDVFVVSVSAILITVPFFLLRKMYKFLKKNWNLDNLLPANQGLTTDL